MGILTTDPPCNFFRITGLYIIAKNIYTVFLSRRDISALELLISYYRHWPFLIEICNVTESPLIVTVRLDNDADRGYPLRTSVFQSSLACGFVKILFVWRRSPDSFWGSWEHADWYSLYWYWLWPAQATWSVQ